MVRQFLDIGMSHTVGLTDSISSTIGTSTGKFLYLTCHFLLKRYLHDYFDLC